jgi:hypothetical protein
MVLDPITIAKTTLSMLNAHVWHVAIEAKFTNLNKTKHGSLQPCLKEGKQLTPNGCLKSRQKLMEPSTYVSLNLLFKEYFQILSFYYAKTFSLVMKMNSMAKTH